MTAQRTNTKKRRLPPSKATLKGLTEAAIVDAYDESMQRTGIYTMLDEHLDTPFETEILGLPARPLSRLAISIFDVPLPDPRPTGADTPPVSARGYK